MNLKGLLSERHVAKGQWWERPWSLVDGCTKCSPGCLHCWAESVAMHFLHVAEGTVGPEGWTGKVMCREDRLLLPLHLKRPILWAIWNDLFHENVPEDFRDDAHVVMAASPGHAFLVLTKRAAGLRRYYGEDRTDCWSDAVNMWLWEGGHIADEAEVSVRWPLANVGLGVSVPDQPTADRDIPILLETPAALRFVNCGPLLGPVNLAYLQRADGLLHDTLAGWTWPAEDDGKDWQTTPTLDWVAVECESGPKRRPCELEWVADVVEQCQDARVPVWVKQVQVGRERRVSKDMSEWPEGIRVREMPQMLLCTEDEGR